MGYLVISHYDATADVDVRTRTAVLQFWNRLCLMDHSRLTRQIFVIDHQLSQQSHSWSQVIKHDLETCGLASVWSNFNADMLL